MLLLIKKNGRIHPGVAAAVVLIAIAAGIAFYFMQQGNNPETSKTQSDSKIPANGTAQTQKLDAGAVQGDIIVKPKIDYHSLDKDESLKEMMGSRKEGLGIKKSLDMIVTSDETFQIGDNKVSMQDILKKSKIKKGEVHVQPVGGSDKNSASEKVSRYGIYVVQPNDNIWNIHFNILKEYYENRGINVSPKADEPGQKGMSSGVGKILKFSETMVVIYNMKEEKVTTDIDLIEPLSKIVVYNMDEVFSLLSKINYENINRLQFDGRTIWIPAKK